MVHREQSSACVSLQVGRGINVFLKALVVPSQSLYSDCHMAWVLVKDDGGVVAAHCKCKAG